MSNGVDLFIDLRGVQCPENYVRIKLALEELERGQKLEVYLDDGEPMRSVPRSLKDDGQRISKVERCGSYFSLEVTRSA
jgi:tRNA 2-thiouridine synthesizing protein A